MKSRNPCIGSTTHRAVLTEAQVVEIYQYQKKTTTVHHSFALDPSLKGRTTYVARKYNVCPKTIRDIWNRRAWSNETRFM
jgi:hypothetical protein